MIASMCVCVCLCVHRRLVRRRQCSSASVRISGHILRRRCAHRRCLLPLRPQPPPTTTTPATEPAARAGAEGAAGAEGDERALLGGHVLAHAARHGRGARANATATTTTAASTAAKLLLWQTA